MVCISVDILTPAPVQTVGMPHNIHFAVYYDGTLNYFDKNHMPYAVLAMVFIVISTIFPIIFLIAYPCRCCQRILNQCKLNPRILRTFMDSVQGAYKDGTDGEWNFQWFSSVDFLLRVFVYIFYMYTLNSMFFPLAVLYLIIVLIALVNIKPYKESLAHYMNIDATFFLLLALVNAAMSARCIASLTAMQIDFYLQTVIVIVIAVVPLLYMTILCLHWMFAARVRRMCTERIIKWRAWRKGYEEITNFEPDRMENPQHYSTVRLENTASLRRSISNDTY